MRFINDGVHEYPTSLGVVLPIWIQLNFLAIFGGCQHFVQGSRRTPRPIEKIGCFFVFSNNFLTTLTHCSALVMNRNYIVFRQKYLFLLIVSAIYLSLFVKLDFLQGPMMWDEGHFWQTSLGFSNRLFPTIDQLRSYNELTTPLPFVMYGVLEYLFRQGIFAGRLLSLSLSILIVLLIGWPKQRRDKRSLLCFVGLIMCPYYLWYCGLLYTDIIACFWVLLGFVAYVRNRHLWSCIAFIFAIASRQYMLVFPLAIALQELARAVRADNQPWLTRIRSLNWPNWMMKCRSAQWWSHQWRWIAPLVAALSIFGWFYLFQGLTPQIPIVESPGGLPTVPPPKVPTVQKTVWAITPGVALNFLAWVSLYIVIPEAILFHPIKKLRRAKSYIECHWPRVVLIALGLLLFTLCFPPSLSGLGLLAKITSRAPAEGLATVFVYGLSLLACLRFNKIDLLSLSILLNSLLMMKAYPWDKYILPLVVVFWYLKSIGYLDGYLGGSVADNPEKPSSSSPLSEITSAV